MGPRRIRRGDEEVPIGSELNEKWLQWGPGQFAVETTAGRAALTADVTASMGPRRIRRGDRLPAAWPAPAAEGFNGATANSPWRRGGGPTNATSMSRCFNGATANSPWRH